MDVKEAVSIAVQYVMDLYGGQDVRDFRLEEVEISDDETYWFVTVGFSQPKPKLHPLDQIAMAGYERVYKRVKIEDSTGRVLSMAIRIP